ncbi:MAG: prolyl oligopeptidase family serine peptidase [Clostridia bacterium]|nr:prolyl oligopeptidase family serine peptidase [Clostridia bacterium]MBR0217275.1 prolyl oligopeptidase family serine peptidase [Clostridia bacterium]
MAFCTVQFFSEALVVAVSVNVIYPEKNMGIGVEAGKTEELPQVLYLLHGYSDDHSIWMRRTSVERYAAKHNLAIIMPAVNHSFYCNEVHGERYWDFVSEELPRVMHSFFRLSDKPEDTFVAGLSMGGYGAMRLALMHPDRFAAAASFSGALDMASRVSDPKSAARFANIFGENASIKNTEYDLLYMLKKQAKAEHRPRLYVSCGTADGLFAAHKKFCTQAKKTGWDLETEEVPDAVHEWGLWDSQIEKFIASYIR